MDADPNDIKVVAPLTEIEFLNLDDVGSDQERSYLYNCVKSHHEAPLPGSSSRPWQTPKREPDIELDFGSATAVFNSLQSGANQSHISLPPYIAGIPLPGSCPPQPQHIHINNFTANLNFPAGQHTVVSNPSQAPLPTQPMPFTVGYPSSGPYVAPFPQPSPSPPVYGGPIMVYQPPLLSMYQPQPQPQPPYQQHQTVTKQEHKETGGSTPIMFGSTPVVSVKHSSSDEEEVPVPQAGVQEAAGLGPTPSQPPINPSSPPATSPKSWASLFTPSPGSMVPGAGDKPTARIPPFTPQVQQGSQGSPEEREMASYLAEYSLNHVAPSFLPRGLTNRSNWCFVNAILQALLACPPFYNLMKNLPSVTGLKSGKSTTPMIDSVVEFINEMSPLETMNKNQKKDKARKKEDLPTGNALEPSYVYKTLLQLESETFKVIEGRQEDAEEFLTCLLNMISDEMVSLLKLLEETKPESEQGTRRQSSELAGGLEWQEVGTRGKSCITRRIKDQTNIVTPVQQLALGLCRYSVKSANNETSATLQPFFTLQLDIQSDSITSVNDALTENFSSEQLDGYICSKTKQEVEASRNLSLEELPPILILHLKRFVYNGNTGGCQKVMKQVDFSVDLEIGRDILSQPSKSKYTTKQRQYKLFGVVYHKGMEATKGHYVTDVYHTGYASWLHCDDSIIQPTAEQLVTSPSPSSTPYILFYRRGDTMVGVEKTIK